MSTSPKRDDRQVAAALGELSERYEPLPESVARRLDSALDELPELEAPDSAPPIAAPIRVPWWRRRFALSSAVGTVTVAVVAAALLIVQPFGVGDSGAGSDINAAAGRSSTAEEDDSNRLEGKGPESKSTVGDYTSTYSGTEYAAGDLEDARGLTETGDVDLVDDELTRLVDDAAVRDECLSGLVTVFDAMPTSVDFGTFEEAPAMITVLESSGHGAVVAVGKHCGPSDTDIRGAVTF